MKIEERAYWLAWSQISGVGPTLLFRLQQHFGALAEAWKAEVGDLCHVGGIGPQTAQAIAQSRAQLNPNQLLETHAQTNTHFWTPADIHYPQLLLETPDPPPVLYYRGHVEPGENQGIIPMVGIVGTREPSDYGQGWTRRIARTLADAGFSIVSGLAMGIDAIAHQSCLEVNGRTVAVIGTGVNIAYPWSNRRLAEHIAARGLIVSEYPMGTKPHAAHFPKRNRIIAGLCRAILVMEAPMRSGALITARMANDYGRDVYVLPGSLDEKRAVGCLHFVNQGAQVILGEQHLLEALGAIPHLHPKDHTTSVQSLPDSSIPETPPPQSFPSNPRSVNTVSPMQKQPSIPLESQAQKVWEVVPPQSSIPLDTIVHNSQLPTGDVLASLAQLELLELVTQLPGMRYQRTL